MSFIQFQKMIFFFADEKYENQFFPVLRCFQVKFRYGCFLKNAQHIKAQLFINFKNGSRARSNIRSEKTGFWANGV